VITIVGTNSPATGLLREGDVILAIWSEHPAAAPSGWDFVFFMLTFLFFLVAGVTAFLLKPGDEQAWLLALMLSTWVAIFPLYFYLQLPRWMLLTAPLTQTLSTIFFSVFVRFFLVFPERSPLLRRFPEVEWLIYLPYLLFLLPLITLRTVLNEFQLTPPWRQSFMGRDREFRNRPGGVELNRILPTLWGWFDTGLLFTMPLIPLSFAYAIIRHKVIPVSLIIRRGLRYLLVSRGSVLVLMAAVCVMTFFVMDALSLRWWVEA
jgi:hypothetical protein